MMFEAAPIRFLSEDDCRVVSSGPAQISVPNVVALTQAAAITAITTACLTVGTVTMQSSSAVAGGGTL